jgi:hypothetical protein
MPAVPPLAARVLSAAVLFAALSAAAPAQERFDHRDCLCRANGQFWHQGEETCIAGRMRVCGMDQNVSSWLSTGKGCPTAFAPTNQGLGPGKSRREAFSRRLS